MLTHTHTIPKLEAEDPHTPSLPAFLWEPGTTPHPQQCPEQGGRKTDGAEDLIRGCESL